MKSWLQKLQVEFGQPPSDSNYQRIFLEFLDSLTDKSKSKTQFFASVGLKIMRKSDSIALLIPRHILSRLFPFDPLRKMPPSPISASILTSEKDLVILPYSISGLLQATSNSISSLQIVCPENIRQNVQEVLNKTGFAQMVSITISTDEEILNEADLGVFKFVNSVAKMEFLKLLIGYQSITPILILDGDTILLRSRNWISGLNQLTPVAQEYFLGHINFSKRILQVQQLTGMGYVTHHAIFFPEQVKKIFDAAGGVDKLADEINKGIKLGWGNHGEFPSEWQVYGDALAMSNSIVRQYPANFSNIGIDRKFLKLVQHPSEEERLTLICRLKKTAPALGSISLHDYK